MSERISEFQPADVEEMECPCCAKCGQEKDWADCWQIDCEEGYYDAYEEDCINNDPGTYVKCDTCEGKGGWWHCPNPTCSPQRTGGSLT